MPRITKKRTTKHPRKKTSSIHYWLMLPFKWLGLWLPARPLYRRIVLSFLAILIGSTAVMFATAQWYINKHADEPLVIGATFIPSYAEHFGLDPKETMTAMIDELGLKRLRIVSYWSEFEKEPGQINFDELDWQFKLAEEKGVAVSLSIGLRQPRWPECHMPTWAERLTKAQWSEKLKVYMEQVIKRYKDHPALVEYQLENEFFLKVFGICPDHSRERLVDEFNFVEGLDPNTPIVVTRSNNALGLPIGEPRADKFGVSVYKRVWDKTLTKRYYEYPLPAWFYAALAGGGEIVTGKDLFIHELQTEAWLPDTGDFAMNDFASIREQEKSLNSDRLRDRIRYGEATGMKTIDLWGAEWWYWRKQKANDPSLWNTAKEEISRATNAKD